jgi:hypothetical protein
MPGGGAIPGGGIRIPGGGCCCCIPGGGPNPGGAIIPGGGRRLPPPLLLLLLLLPSLGQPSGGGLDAMVNFISLVFCASFFRLLLCGAAGFGKPCA